MGRPTAVAATRSLRHLPADARECSTSDVRGCAVVGLIWRPAVKNDLCVETDVVTVELSSDVPVVRVAVERTAGIVSLGWACDLAGEPVVAVELVPHTAAVFPLKTQDDGPVFVVGAPALERPVGVYIVGLDRPPVDVETVDVAGRVSRHSRRGREGERGDDGGNEDEQKSQNFSLTLVPESDIMGV